MLCHASCDMTIAQYLLRRITCRECARPHLLMVQPDRFVETGRPDPVTAIERERDEKVTAQKNVGKMLFAANRLSFSLRINIPLLRGSVVIACLTRRQLRAGYI